MLQQLRSYSLPERIVRFSGKCRSVMARRGFRIILAAALLYILDAWILGSTALFLTDIKKGLYYYKHPLEAAVQIPVHASPAIWLIINLLVLMIIGMAAGFLFIRFPELSSKVFRKKVEYIDDPTCGTARWMEPHEVSRILEFGHGPGILFGTYDNVPVRLYQKSRLNRNVVVFGPPGSGKTWSEVLPNVLQAVTNAESIIIIDPKSEIAKATLRFFQKREYNVKVFNLVDMLISDRWNPLDSVTNDIDAQLFTEVVIANTAVPGIKKMGGDPFWDRAEQNLLKALTLYVKMEYPREKQNIHSIYSLLAAGDMDQLDLTFRNLDEDHPAKAPYNIYSQAAGTVKGGVIQGLGTRLQVFANEQVRKLTEVSDIDLEAPGKEPCVFYCVVSDTDSTFDFLSSLFFSFLFIKLTKLGDRSPGGSCPVKVNFMLDEFCNIGAIPDFKKRIATMRSRGISCTIITQSLPQLENRYPSNAWQEIISCCDSRLFLGVNDNHTAKYLSDSLGVGTVEQISIDRKTDDLMKAGIKKSPKARHLMTPDEALRMDETKAVLIIRGRKPIEIKKLAYTEHPLAGELEPVEMSDYRPAWQIMPESEPSLKITWEPDGADSDEDGIIAPADLGEEEIPPEDIPEEEIIINLDEEDPWEKELVTDDFFDRRD